MGNPVEGLTGLEEEEDIFLRSLTTMDAPK
jgi:hypothetical protein